jgi:hypothetical protein
MGLAEQALARWVDAETHVARALDAAQTRGSRSTGRRSRRHARRSPSTSDGSRSRDVPDGAEVRLDGELVGTLPLRRPLRVPAGEVLVDVTAAGHRTFTRTVSIVPGQVRHEEIVLAAPRSAPKRVSAPARRRATHHAGPGNCKRRKIGRRFERAWTRARGDRGPRGDRRRRLPRRRVRGPATSRRPVRGEGPMHTPLTDSRCVRTGATRHRSAYARARIASSRAGAAGVTAAVLFIVSRPAREEAGDTPRKRSGSCGPELAIALARAASRALLSALTR